MVEDNSGLRIGDGAIFSFIAEMGATDQHQTLTVQAKPVLVGQCDRGNVVIL